MTPLVLIDEVRQEAFGTGDIGVETCATSAFSQGADLEVDILRGHTITCFEGTVVGNDVFRNSVCPRELACGLQAKRERLTCGDSHDFLQSNVSHLREADSCTDTNTLLTVEYSTDRRLFDTKELCHLGLVQPRREKPPENPHEIVDLPFVQVPVRSQSVCTIPRCRLGRHVNSLAQSPRYRQADTRLWCGVIPPKCFPPIFFYGGPTEICQFEVCAVRATPAVAESVVETNSKTSSGHQGGKRIRIHHPYPVRPPHYREGTTPGDAPESEQIQMNTIGPITGFAFVCLISVPS